MNILRKLWPSYPPTEAEARNQHEQRIAAAAKKPGGITYVSMDEMQRRAKEAALERPKEITMGELLNITNKMMELIAKQTQTMELHSNLLTAACDRIVILEATIESKGAVKQ